jgi:D-alanyl-D-alanine endopeptidase (penicillin-binding protein 7)
MLLKILISLLLIKSSAGVYLIQNEPFLELKRDKLELTAPTPKRTNDENIDVASGQVLIGQNASEVQPLASISKLMTALVILDQKPNWTRIVELMTADETVGATPHINRGEQVSFKDLWFTSLVGSDNNAIHAMIRSLGISEADFIDLLNKKASDLGLLNTHFEDPTGLSEQNVSTATDVAKLIYYSMKRNEIREAVLKESDEIEIINKSKGRRVINTDILLGSFLNDDSYGYELLGGKTGFIPAAGYCLGVEVKHNEHAVIFVVLHSATIGSRFQDVKVLADWVFMNYKW